MQIKLDTASNRLVLREFCAGNKEILAFPTNEENGKIIESAMNELEAIKVSIRDTVQHLYAYGMKENHPIVKRLLKHIEEDNAASN